MKYAISNIAWDHADEMTLLPFLRNQGVSGIEVAPTKVWPDWDGLNTTSARIYAHRLKGEGFDIPSMQGIFYGKQLGSIFDASNHLQILNHLTFIADIASEMGVRTVIFGAPSMRQNPQIRCDSSCKSILPFLKAAAEIFSLSSLILCIEACSAYYNCNFITKHSDLIHMIDLVNEPGFGLHIDAANLFETNERLAEIWTSRLPVQHFHMNEPGLVGFTLPRVPHADNINFLKSVNYSNWISIEMLSSSLSLSSDGPWHIIQKRC
jgi:D-psicose/D-tagatose/L-ribulose 3-epimerase